MGRLDAVSGLGSDLAADTWSFPQRTAILPSHEPPRESQETHPFAETDEDLYQRYLIALGRVSDAERKVIVARLKLGMEWEQVAGVHDKPSADAARVAVSKAPRSLAREPASQDKAGLAVSETSRQSLRQRLLDFLRRFLLSG